MKNVLKASHLFYCCFLSGISLLLLTGCETQESIISNAKPTGTEFTGQVQPITMQQLRGIPGAFARLKELQPKLNHGVALAKTEEEYFNAVDTTQVVLIEVNGKQTVTMRIIPDDASDKTENLVLQTSNDGLSFNAYVFEYNPDAAQKALISQGVPIGIIPKSIKYLTAPANTTVNETYSVPADGDGAECVTIYSKIVDYCKDSSGKEIVVTGSLSDNCAGGYHSVTYFIMDVDMGCLGGGGDGSGSDGGSTGGTGGSTGGGSGGTGGGTGTGSGGNPPGNNGPGTPQAPQNYIGGVPTIPIFIANTVGAQLYNHFNASQLNWWDTTATADEKAAFIDYAGQHMNGTAIDADVLVLIQQLMEQFITSGLNFDIAKSLASPANIDLSELSGTASQQDRFNNIYNHLTSSALFKQMFVNLFANNAKYNVKFKIGPMVNSNNYAETTVQLLNGNIYNFITINPAYLDGGSDASIATTIIHELIHAFLNVLRNSQGITPSVLSGQDLATNIVNYYANQLLGVNAQHNFMALKFGPVINQILTDIKSSLFTATDIQKVEHPEIYNNYYLYLPLNLTASNPTSSSSVTTPWIWNDFFTYQSYEGLHNSSAFTDLYPMGSTGYYYFYKYISIATIAFGHYE